MVPLVPSVMMALRSGRVKPGAPPSPASSPHLPSPRLEMLWAGGGVTALMVLSGSLSFVVSGILCLMLLLAVASVGLGLPDCG